MLGWTNIPWLNTDMVTDTDYLILVSGAWAESCYFPKVKKKQIGTKLKSWHAPSQCVYSDLSKNFYVLHNLDLDTFSQMLIWRNEMSLLQKYSDLWFSPFWQQLQFCSLLVSLVSTETNILNTVFYYVKLLSMSVCMGGRVRLLCKGRCII